MGGGMRNPLIGLVVCLRCCGTFLHIIKRKSEQVAIVFRWLKIDLPAMG